MRSITTSRFSREKWKGGRRLRPTRSPQLVIAGRRPVAPLVVYVVALKGRATTTTLLPPPDERGGRVGYGRPIPTPGPGVHLSGHSVGLKWPFPPIKGGNDSSGVAAGGTRKKQQQNTLFLCIAVKKPSTKIFFFEPPGGTALDDCPQG
jgi:hypothetical protein